jgi:hypothetical protein
MKRMLVLIIAVALVVIGAVVALSIQGNGDVDRWNVKDTSTDPSPVAVAAVLMVAHGGDETFTTYVTDAKPRVIKHKGKVRHIRVHDRSGDKHRPRNTALRTSGAVWCRTARAEGTGGNVLFPSLVRAGISQQFCWNSSNNNIVSYGRVNMWATVTDSGRYWLWHTDNNGELVVATNARTCASGTCWDYGYRRGLYRWHQGIPKIGPIELDKCLSITMRGTGDVIVGRPSC